MAARFQLRALSLIRHAESAGNVANDAALASGRHELDLAIRDMDVPLSGLGEKQARALGGRLSSSSRRARDALWTDIETVPRHRGPAS